MLRRRAPLGILLSLALSACATTRAQTTTPTLSVPATLDEDGSLTQGLNAYASLSLDDARRGELRVRLLEALVEVGDDALAAAEYPAMMNAFETCLTLWTAAELSTAPPPPPSFVRFAGDVYREAARRGMETQALLALAVRTHFDTTQAVAMNQEWAQLAAWLESGEDFARDFSATTGLERTLEQVAAIFPAPWVVAQLTSAYTSRYDQAFSQRAASVSIDESAQRRLAFSGYLLARAYLRADDFPSATRALDTYATDPASRELREVIDRSMDGARGVAAMLELIDNFRPRDEDALPDHVVRQGWGIVEVLARRVLAVEARQPDAHLALAEVFMQRGLEDAALEQYKATLAVSDDIFEAWVAVALLEQRSLERVAERDPREALTSLAALEDFHGRAMQLWRDRPVEPGLPRAYITVGESLYDAGEIVQARDLLENSLGLEPRPRAVDLLGTIALKQRRYEDASTSYESLLALPFDDQYARLRWSIRARSQLGEIALRREDTPDAQAHFRGALQTLNMVLALPNLDEFLRSFWLTERARVLFLAGDTDLAMQDFRDAVSTAPERPLTYAEPLLLMVSHGYHAQANEIFAQAVRHALPPSLKLYFALWVEDLAIRRGVTTPSAASTIIQEFRDDTWVGSLAAHARGELSATALYDRATDRGQRAEADFYEGLRAWRTGDRTGGLDRMRKVIDSGMMSFFEFEMAQSYLRWGELPREAKSPMTP